MTKRMRKNRKNLYGRAQPGDRGFFLTVAAAQAQAGEDSDLLRAVRLWRATMFDEELGTWEPGLGDLLGREPMDQERAAQGLAFVLQGELDRGMLRRRIRVEEFQFTWAWEGDAESVIWAGFADAVVERRVFNWSRCSKCGAVFAPKRRPDTDQPRYCSGPCRTAAYKQRRRAQGYTEQKADILGRADAAVAAAKEILREDD